MARGWHFRTAWDETGRSINKTVKHKCLLDVKFAALENDTLEKSLAPCDGYLCMNPFRFSQGEMVYDKFYFASRHKASAKEGEEW